MEIQFELAFDDFLDALAFHYRRHASQRQKLRKILRLILLIDAGVIAILISVVWLVSGRAFVATFSLRDVVGSAAMSSLPVAPWIELLLFLAVGGFSQRNPRRAKFILVSSLLLVIASALLLFGLAADHEHALVMRQMSRTGNQMTPWGIIPDTFAVGNVFGWVAMFLLSLLTTFIFANAAKRLWNQQPNLARRRTVQFREDGFRVTDDFSSRDYAWTGIEKAVDGRSQLLLYHNKLSFEIIPKRAFENEPMLDQFWRFAAAKGEASAHGFPVRAVIPV